MGFAGLGGCRETGRKITERPAMYGFRSKNTPAPSPAPLSARATVAAKRPQRLARGGVIRGPGTGTSDSIPDEMRPGTYILPADTTAQLGLDDDKVPVRVSNGEYELLPEQVQAIGAAVLDVVKGATHTPAPREPRGFHPPDNAQMFADGGVIDPMAQVQAGGIKADGLAQNSANPQFGGQRAATTAAAAPEAMGWAARNAQRSLEVTASSIMDSPERRAAQAALAPPPAPSAAAAIPTAAAPAASTPPDQGSWAQRNAQRDLQTTASSILDSPERRAAQAALMPPPPASAPTPTTQDPMAAGFRPRYGVQTFSQGGRVKSEEEQERLRRQTEMYVLGAQEAAATRAAAQPAPPNSFGDAAAAMNNPGTVQGRSALGSVATPATAPAPVAAAELPEWSRDQSSYGDQMRSVGQALMNVPKHIISAPGYGFNSDMRRPGETSEAFAQRRAGPSPQAAPAIPAPAPAPAAPTAASVIAPSATTVPTPGTVANPVNGAVTQPDPRPMGDLIANQAQAVSAPTTGNEVRPGVYNHGRGQYSDSAAGMGFRPGFTGQPNAQNLAAAENLSQRDAQRGVAAMAPAAAAFTGVTAPTVLHSGNDWASRNALRNMEVSASSITNNGGRWDSTRGNNPAQDAYRTAMKADIAARGAQPGFDAMAMRENAGLQREGMQQQGGLAQTAMREQGANRRDGARNALTKEELALKREAQGFTTRAAAQAEQLRNVLLDPKATPEQRRTAQENLRAISGAKAEDNRFTVVPGGQEWDTSANAMRNVPARVFNNQTGQFVDQPGQGDAPVVRTPADLAKLPKRAQFMDEQGRMRVKN